MKRAGGDFDPAYNTQTAVDEAALIIVAAELGNTAVDANWLLPMIQGVGNNLAKLPGLAITYTGYCSEESCARDERPRTMNQQIDAVIRANEACQRIERIGTNWSIPAASSTYRCALHVQRFALYWRGSPW